MKLLDRLKCKKKFDERQQADLYRVEHIGFWLLYYMLFADLMIKMILLRRFTSDIISELAVFLVASIWVCAACMKLGIWTPRCQRPTLKHYVGYSLTAGTLGGAIFLILAKLRVDGKGTDTETLLLSFVFMFVSIFLLTLCTFLIMGGIYNKRQKELEKKLEENENEEE